MNNIYQKLSSIQNELVVTKNQRNNFGNYNFRSAEDILEASKPICKKYDTVLKVSDEMILRNDRVYVEATATLFDFEGNFIDATASAREPQTQKGMNEAQITGSASSYARKYALGGLFNLDDNKDADATNKHGKEKASTPKPTYTPKMTLVQKDKIIKLQQEGKTDLDKVLAYYKVKSLDELNNIQAETVIKQGGKK